MKSYVFPGQGSQFKGMCNDLYQKYPSLKEMFKNAEGILGFNISDIMFNGISIGSYARKVIKDLIESDDFYDLEIIRNAVLIATKLVHGNVSR